MHIGFRTSGGRGEYELVGDQSGYNASSLEGWSFKLGWPDGIVRDTDLVLEPAGSGKPRLRSERQPRFQIGRMMAGLLLMPDPRRGFDVAGEGSPVPREKRYVISKVGFSADTEFTGAVDQVTIAPLYLEVRNRTDSDVIGVRERWQRIQDVYALTASLPTSVGQAVGAHQSLMQLGAPAGGCPGSRGS